MTENINVQSILNENEALKREVNELKEHLKKYTNTERHKQYYEKNKEVVNEKARQYLDKLKESDPEKLKEYRRTAYQNRKLKMQQQSNNQ